MTSGKRIALVVVVVGAGIGATVVLRARARDRAEDDELAARSARAEVVWPACSGQAVPQAAAFDTTGTATRPAILFNVSGPDKNHYERAGDPRWLPASVETTQLVACLESAERSLTGCTYGAHFVDRIQYTVHATLREAKTGRIVAERDLLGAEPGSCESAIAARKGVALTKAFHGVPVAEDQILGFVRAHAMPTTAAK